MKVDKNVTLNLLNTVASVSMGLVAAAAIQFDGAQLSIASSAEPSTMACLLGLAVVSWVRANMLIEARALKIPWFLVFVVILSFSALCGSLLLMLADDGSSFLLLGVHLASWGFVGLAAVSASANNTNTEEPPIDGPPITASLEHVLLYFLLAIGGLLLVFGAAAAFDLPIGRFPGMAMFGALLVESLLIYALAGYRLPGR